MKVIKILTHPYLLIISFLFIMISGEHLGGFYMLYLLLALPHGGIHALLAVAGIAILLVSHHYSRKVQRSVIGAIINLIGLACLVLSLVLFFYNDKAGYNNGTFEQFVPQVTLVVFGILATAFIIRSFTRSGNKPVNGNLSLKKA
jgi:vacuolar-type H+-ATPase subunit I/STV1